MKQEGRNSRVRHLCGVEIKSPAQRGEKVYRAVARSFLLVKSKGETQTTGVGRTGGETAQCCITQTRKMHVRQPSSPIRESINTQSRVGHSIISIQRHGGIIGRETQAEWRQGCDLE